MKRISVVHAKPEMILSKDLYNREGHFLLKKGTELDPQIIQKLFVLGITSLYVESSGYELFSNTFINEQGEETGDIISYETRTEAENIIRDLMEDIKSGNNIKVKKVKKVVEHVIKELLGREKIVAKISDIRVLDDYTFAHSVNVCVFAISTGLILGFTPTRLKELGIAALLHDIGKVFMPNDILNKPGELTEEEFQTIKKHTEAGYKFLRSNSDVSKEAARVALEHHEHFNGEGYPRKIRHQAIHQYSQIVALADVYDALTSNRIYKSALKPYEAVELIIASSGYQFEPQLVKQFVQNLSVYPEGCIVGLSNGCVGKVVSVNYEFPIRPKVRLLNDQAGNEINGIEELDLMKIPTLFIDYIIKFNTASDAGIIW